tara:strand:- start:12757 stop:13377 length:621 start_codon:yes stop_codon:yes gene_type:complete
MSCIIFFGDSITYGQYVDHNKRWTYIVNNFFKNNFKNINSYTHAISGQTTRQALERFPYEVQDYYPDLLFIQFGLNDCNKWDTDKGMNRVSPKSYEANLKEMINRARNFGVKKIVLQTSHRTLKSNKLIDGSYFEDHRVEYNKILKSVSRNKKTFLLDIEEEFAKIDESKYSQYLLGGNDLLHLSVLGHQYYSECVVRFINESNIL